MNDDTRERRWRDNLPRLFPRYALLACLALAVVTLGVALTPARPPEPAAPSFSEQARAAALTETLRLEAAGSRLATPADSPAGGSAGAGNAAVERTVTLLTTQAQALLPPGESPSDGPTPTPAETDRATSGTPASSATPAPSATGSPAAGSPAAGSSTAAPITRVPSVAPLPATPAALVAALADSGRQRLADAARADGGMARLLAAVGTGQLLQASALAAGTGTAAPPPADVAFPHLSDTCPSATVTSQSVAGQPGAGSAESGPGGSSATSRADATDAAGTPGSHPAGASAAAALAAVLRTEAQAIYAYQVALPRLGGDAAKSAVEELARHDALLSGAESLSRAHCSAVPPREAGYTLARSFLASPAAGLGDLEAASLPVYGDLVALSEGETRQWAIAALYGSGRRAVLWGADPGALPGLDRASLPPQPSLPAG